MQIHVEFPDGAAPIATLSSGEVELVAYRFIGAVRTMLPERVRQYNPQIETDRQGLRTVEQGEIFYDLPPMPFIVVDGKAARHPEAGCDFSLKRSFEKAGSPWIPQKSTKPDLWKWGEVRSLKLVDGAVPYFEEQLVVCREALLELDIELLGEDMPRSWSEMGKLYRRLENAVEAHWAED